MGLFSNTGNYRNKVGLDERWILFLKEEFRELEKHKRRITKDILRYLLDDEGAGVLTEVKNITRRNKSSLLPGSGIPYMNNMNKKEIKSEFYLKAWSSDPGFYYRLAQIYVSLSSSARYYFSGKNFTDTLQWVIVFLNSISYRIAGGYAAKKHSFFDFLMMEKMLEYVGEKPDLLMDEVFLSPSRYSYYSAPDFMICRLNGFRDRVSAYADIVNKALDDKNAKIREHALQTFIKYKVDILPFLEKMIQLAVSSSKKVREAAVALPLKEKQQTKTILERIIKVGKSAEKIHAVTLYSTLYQKKAEGFLKEQSGLVPDGKLKTVISENLSIFHTLSKQTGSPDFDLPEPVKIPVHQPLHPETKEHFYSCIHQYNEEVRKFIQRLKQDKRYKPAPPVFMTDHSAKNIILFMETFVLKARKSKPIIRFSYPVCLQQIYNFLTLPDVTLTHTVRLYIAFNGIDTKSNNVQWFRRFQYVIKDIIQSKDIDFFKLSEVFTVVGLDADIIGQSYLLKYSTKWFYDPLYHLPDNKIWPYFSNRLYLIEEALGLLPQKKLVAEGYWSINKKYNGLKALSSFPSIPPQFISIVWNLALKGTKELQPPAKKCARKIPGFENKVIAGLSSGKQDIRINAALWLKEIEYKGSINNLKAALKKEKSEKARAVFMETLEALGVPVKEFMDTESLRREAQKKMAKGIPEKLSWFAFKQLPAVKWKDTENTVEQEIITWFIVRSYKLKSPVPDPYLRLYYSEMKQEDAYLLGQFVLKSWIYQDTIPRYTHEEAAQLAQKDLIRIKAFVQKYPQYYTNWSEEAYLKQRISYLKNECLGSAIQFKGLLAITAACGNPESIKPAYDYIKYWYGQRAAQGKALIQMLAWIDNKNANQILLSIGRRFRTKGIQEEAAFQINELAKRKGWTTDELADRTIPAAGLDENGELVLDYGNRVFTASLDDQMRLVLRNQENKIIKALPKPNKADNEFLAKEAKKLFSASKKELKQVLTLQKERLYEAFCVQKKWKFADWNEYLNNHPIVTHYCRRLLWSVFENNSATTLFRPLADRSLTTVDDEELSIDDTADIGIVHDIHVREEVKKRWQDHLRDYEVKPLFTQFGKDFYELPEQKKNKKVLTDYRGFLIESYALRNVLTKLGYSRGQAEDGGWFFTYVKNFPVLELQAVITFSGNSLPEESRTVALDTLYFVRKIDTSYGFFNKVYLKDIPGVLLSECYNDMAQAAKAGTGYDAQWEETVRNW